MIYGSLKYLQSLLEKSVTMKRKYTVLETLFGTIALNDHISLKYSSNLKSKGRFEQLVQFCVQNCPWKLNLMKNEGSYECFNIKIWGILSFLSPFAEIESEYSVFSTFLVLLGIGFVFGQFLKGIPVLKSSEHQLSPRRIHF